MTQPLSVVYITLNAERCLAESLKSVALIADDIVLVDSGSTDATKSIAKAHGARVFDQAWLGFGPQKQRAVEHALHNWVLVVDADEVVSPEASQSVRNALGAENLPAGFTLRRRNFFHGAEIRFGDWAGDRVLRLVDRRAGRFSDNHVHERWLTSGKVAAIGGCMLHYPFENYGAMLAKLARYSDLNAQELFKRRGRPSAIAPLTHGISAFLRCYFLKMGLLDGTDGFGIALVTALGSFLKYAKAREIASGSSNHINPSR
jgi:(heptosyl)LPS beta-1,4-glucosyltransferase